MWRETIHTCFWPRPRSRGSWRNPKVFVRTLCDKGIPGLFLPRAATQLTLRVCQPPYSFSISLSPLSPSLVSFLSFTAPGVQAHRFKAGRNRLWLLLHYAAAYLSWRPYSPSSDFLVILFFPNHTISVCAWKCWKRFTIRNLRRNKGPKGSLGECLGTTGLPT